MSAKIYAIIVAIVLVACFTNRVVAAPARKGNTKDQLSRANPFSGSLQSQRAEASTSYGARAQSSQPLELQQISSTRFDSSENVEEEDEMPADAEEELRRIQAGQAAASYISSAPQTASTFVALPSDDPADQPAFDAFEIVHSGDADVMGDYTPPQPARRRRTGFARMARVFSPKQRGKRRAS